MRILTITLACCGLFLGCGGTAVDGLDLQTVSGKATHKGQPLADAQITLISDTGGTIAIGQTDASGNFTLTTKGQPGAVAGSHKVTVVSAATNTAAPPEEGTEEYAKMMAGEAPTAESPLPEKYADAKTSGLTATVKVGDNQITVELAD